MSALQRWQLKDLQTGSVFNFPNNPNKMSSPNQARAISGVPVNSGTNVMERNADVHTWTFSGTVYSSTDYQNLRAALSSTNRQQLTDHLGRVYIVRIKQYQISERMPSRARGTWRFDYQVTAMTYYRAS